MEAGRRSKVTIPKDAGQQRSPRLPFVLFTPGPHRSRRPQGGCSTMRGAKVTGFGNGNSEPWIAPYSSIRRNTDGHGFRVPSVGSFPRLFHSSHSNNRFLMIQRTRLRSEFNWAWRCCTTEHVLKAARTPAMGADSDL